MLWRDTSTDVANEAAVNTGTIHLWPNGLRWWFLGFALFFMIVVGSSGLFCSWWSFGISLAAVFVWMVWVYPFFVFYVRRREVLSDLWGTWPPQMDVLYGQVPALVTKSSKRSPLSLLKALLPYGREYRSAANGETTPAALEYVALADYFASKSSLAESSLADIWCDRGFLRWLATRCGPVVAGQVVTLVLVVWAFLFQAEAAIFPILGWTLVWTMLAVGFLRNAACTFERESRVPLEDLSRLPYLTHTLENTYLLQTLPELTVPLVVTAAGINLTFAIPLLGVA